jgi:FkbM family methyltransferase
MNVRRRIKRLITGSVAAMGNTVIGRAVYAQIVGDMMGQTRAVTHHGVKLVFAVPNALSMYRADTFSTKEPETLEWIDGIPQGCVLWDIGANVGLYSCYAAKRRTCRVFAFEPSVFNLELLARNVFLNQLTGLVTIVPLPLTDTLTVSTLNMASTAWGGSLSTFGQAYGHDGQPLQKVFEFRTIGLSMTDAVERLRIPQPDYIKMDVDGIEHLILRGAMPVLAKAKGVLIEINDQFATQANDARRCLVDAGFSLKEKRHAAYFDDDASAARHTFNQIWAR